MCSSFLFSGKEYAKKENLKEMGDVTSGMASTVIQVYLKAILNSYIHPKLMARQVWPLTHFFLFPFYKCA